MTTKVIKGGTVCTADRTWKADVLIEDEKIKQIGEDLKGDEYIDADGAYVIPGGIDPHTHLEMPFMGTTAAETFESGTWAAAAGGTTMLIDFCLPGEDGSIKNAINEWHRKSAPQICADIGYHMAITGWNESIFNEMKDAVDMGVNSFKHFMAYKGALMVNDDELYASFQRCAELGATPMVHAENGDVVAELSAKLLAEGKTAPRYLAHAHPPSAEIEVGGGRILHVPKSLKGVGVYSFKKLCSEARGAPDYLAIARAYHTVILVGIPQMGKDMRNEAARFVTLIDALYEHRVKLFATAAAEPDDLYIEGDGAFEFERTASRLMEMRSDEYMALGHGEEDSVTG